MSTARSSDFTGHGQGRHRAQTGAGKITHERETQYRLLFENMITGFALHEIVCDKDGQPVDYRYLEVNPAFERLTGLAASNLLGRTARREALPAVEKNWIRTPLAMSGTDRAKRAISPIRNYQADAFGKYYEHLGLLTPKLGQFAVVFRTDITGRKHAEESLLESRRLYEGNWWPAYRLTGFSAVSCRNEKFARFEYVSERFCEITGMDRATVLAQPRRGNQHRPP